MATANCLESIPFPTPAAAARAHRRVRSVIYIAAADLKAADDAGWKFDDDVDDEDGKASSAKLEQAAASLSLLPNDSLHSPAKVMELACTTEAVRARLIHTELQMGFPGLGSPTRRRSSEELIKRSASLPAIRLARGQQRHSHDGVMSRSRLSWHPGYSRARPSVQDESREGEGVEKALEASSLPGSFRCRSMTRGGASALKPVRSTRMAS